jgi:uncharacterized protein YbbC (DUF1343 family)
MAKDGTLRRALRARSARPRAALLFPLLLGPFAAGCADSQAALPAVLARPEPGPEPRRLGPLRLGIEELLDHYVELVEGRRVGLVTNPSGVDGDLVPTVDRLAALAAEGRFELVRLFAPEHGIRGDVPAGEAIQGGVDERTGVPVASLYGGTRRPPPETLADLDVLLFDVQDVGTRFYTYGSTLGEVLLAAAEVGTEVVVLDRPNPLGGERFDGPVIEERWQSFIGWGPVPIVHGLTIGELALYYNEVLGLGAALTVVPMSGWRRSQVWADTGLDWTPTSPHIPRELAAHAYVATALAASVTTNVSDGVGTPMPFEVLGTAFADADELARDLAARALPGVRFQATAFRPFYGRFAGQTMHGVRLLIDEPRAFEPVRTALALLVSLRNLYPEDIALADEETCAKHWGNELVRTLLAEGCSELALHSSWQTDLARYARDREKVLIYD